MKGTALHVITAFNAKNAPTPNILSSYYEKKISFNQFLLFTRKIMLQELSKF